MPEAPVNAHDAAVLALVVDDDPEVLDVVAELLAQVGVRIIATANPDTAVELAATRAPDVILLDIVMPRMDGYTLATRLRQDPRTADIPIIFVTGQGAPISGMLSHGIGAVAQVQKPLTLTTLRAAVGLALSG